MGFNPTIPFQELLEPESDPQTCASAIGLALSGCLITPGMVPVQLVTTGAGPYYIPPQGLCLTASGWSFQSTNTVPLTLASSGAATIPFTVTQTGTAGAVVAGTTLTLYPALAGVVATALGTPTAAQGQGFPVENWPANGSAASMVKAFGGALAPSSALIGALAGSATLSTAPGNPPDATTTSNQTWLDLTAKSKFGVLRQQGVFGQYSASITVASGKGPYTISPQAFWVTDSTNTYRYQSQNAAPVTISNAGAVVVTFQAEQIGTAYNPGWTGTMTQVTPLLGVTVAAGAVVVSGTDTEQDLRLILRCQTQWATLTTAATFQTIINRALNFDPAITAVYVDDQNPSGPGTYTVYLATSAGTYGTPSHFTQVLGSTSAGLVYGPLESTPTVTSASVLALAVIGTVYCPSANVAAVTAKLTALFNLYQQNQEIGDGATSAGTVFLSDLYRLCMAAGAIYVDFSTPTTDTTVGKGYIAVIPNPITNNTLVVQGV